MSKYFQFAKVEDLKINERFAFIPTGQTPTIEQATKGKTFTLKEITGQMIEYGRVTSYRTNLINANGEEKEYWIGVDCLLLAIREGEEKDHRSKLSSMLIEVTNKD